MTWHSDADFIRDLAYLDDFCTAENSYEVLYSFGRGSLTKLKPKESYAFVDPRTGESIDLTSEVLEAKDTHKSRGRGSFLGSCAKSKLQLQKQLRLARPLGSGNEIIESYCKRNIPTESHTSSSSKPIIESDIREVTVSPEVGSTGSQPEKIRQEVKATRNSKQQNALINSLISGGLTTSKPKDSESDDCFQNFHYNGGIDTDRTESDNCSYTSAGYLSSSSSMPYCSSTGTRESDEEKFLNDKAIKTDYEITYTNIRDRKNVKSVNNCDKGRNQPHDEGRLYNFDRLSKHLDDLNVCFNQNHQENTCIHSSFNFKEFPPLQKK